MRVGATQSQETDVRIIAATNRSPLQAVADGRLRVDLMYRLNVFPIDLPPLRERLSDVPLLAGRFLRLIGEQEGKEKRFAPEALTKLAAYAWPGNVRELQNAAERFALGLELALDGDSPGPVDQAQAAPGSGNLSDQVEQFERSLIAAELTRPHSSMRSLAEALGVPRKTLHDKLRKHGLSFADSGASGADETEDTR